MFQEIITYAILMIIAGVLFARFYGFFKKPASHCEGCFASKSGCKVAELKKSAKTQKIT
jgi:hypothetical protein